MTLNHGEEPSPELYADVRNWVRKEIGPLATPDVLHWTDSLPKTRSGKIMRRILRKIAAGDTSNLGDTSTLADPGVVENCSKRSSPSQCLRNLFSPTGRGPVRASDRTFLHSPNPLPIGRGIN